jgi:hypothetical protein
LLAALFVQGGGANLFRFQAQFHLICIHHAATLARPVGQMLSKPKLYFVNILPC